MVFNIMLFNILSTTDSLTVDPNWSEVFHFGPWTAVDHLVLRSTDSGSYLSYKICETHSVSMHFEEKSSVDRRD